MKELDKVRFIKDRAEYAKRGVKRGDVGTILDKERNGYVLVVIDGDIYRNKDAECIARQISI